MLQEIQVGSGGDGGGTIDITRPDKVFFWSGANQKSSGKIPTDKRVKKAIISSYGSSSGYYFTHLLDIENQTAHVIGRSTGGNVDENRDERISNYITEITDDSITIKGTWALSSISYYGVALYY